MKRALIHLTLLLLAVQSIVCCERIKPGEIPEIQDESFAEALFDAGVDINRDGIISYDEAAQLGKLELRFSGIHDISGIEAFVNLDSLVLYMLPLKRIQLSGFPGLTYLECILCDLEYADLSGIPKLEELICEKNQLETLLLPGGNSLRSIRCGHNRLSMLEVSDNPGLTSLVCNNNYISEIDLSANTELSQLITCGNQLTSLDVSSSTKLTTLGIDNMPMLKKVCVWVMPFPPAGLKVLMEYSPNVIFTSECDN